MSWMNNDVDITNLEETSDSTSWSSWFTGMMSWAEKLTVKSNKDGIYYLLLKLSSAQGQDWRDLA